MLDPSDFCLPEECFVHAEEHPSASNGEMAPDPHFEVGFDEPERGTGN